MATVFKIVIKESGAGNPSYWYADKIGSKFECIRVGDIPEMNGFISPVYQIKPDMIKYYSGQAVRSDIIRLQDAEVIDMYEDETIRFPGRVYNKSLETFY